MTDPQQQLSERELEVLRRVAQGATNHQIAQELMISANTVKVHLSRVFNKLGVVSRTEATVVAVKLGLITLPGGAAPEPAAEQAIAAGDGQPGVPVQTTAEVALVEAPEAVLEAPAAEQVSAAPDEQLEQARPRPLPGSRWPWVAGAAVLLALLLALLVVFMPRGSDELTLSPTPLRPVVQRWEPQSPLPEPRADFALVFHSGQGKFYLAGGEGPGGISAAIWSYDPQAKQWSLELSPKPLAVSEVSAAVLRGRVYVPGGRTSTGSLTSSVEVYDPTTNSWSQAAPLPEARSGYGLVELEGRLYLIGGFGPSGPTDTLFEYDVDGDRWLSGPPLPAPLAFPAVAADERNSLAYVVGGENASGVLTSTLRFTPDVPEAWSSLRPLPSARPRSAAVFTDNHLYLLGGSADQKVIRYEPKPDRWGEIALVYGHGLSRAAVAVGNLGEDEGVFTLGGWDGSRLLAENRAFQPIYQIWAPISSS